MTITLIQAGSILLPSRRYTFDYEVPRIVIPDESLVLLGLREPITFDQVLKNYCLI